MLNSRGSKFSCRIIGCKFGMKKYEKNRQPIKHFFELLVVEAFV